jgi:hypothetical protein
MGSCSNSFSAHRSREMGSQGGPWLVGELPSHNLLHILNKRTECGVVRGTVKSMTACGSGSERERVCTVQYRAGDA